VQSATSSYKRRHGLTLEQRNAIDVLVQGATDHETAEATGVNRVTVTKWRNHDPYFQAELNRRRTEVWGASVDRLRSLIPRALDALEHELAGGANAWRAGLELLKLAGLDRSKGRSDLGGYLVGHHAAEAIIDARACARRPDPLSELLNGEPVSNAERLAALAEIEAAATD
jgi:hypothetical protein